MDIQSTPIENCHILYPQVFKDDRGYFFERFNQRSFEKLTGIHTTFVQDNESWSGYGVIRGMHAQKGKAAQAKLVSVSQGRILDAVFDIRPASKTYGRSFSIELSGDNKKQLFIPKGLLHGFAVLSETAQFIYKCDAFYNKASEIGVHHDDPALGIDWTLPLESRIISKKDHQLPDLKTFLS